MKNIQNQTFEGERAGFKSQGVSFDHCIFQDGESPLKESADLSLSHCEFLWKYPLWYGKKLKLDHCHWGPMARAGVWYSQDIEIKDSLIEGPKNFRRAENISLSNVKIPAGDETFWDCENITLENVEIKGNYVGMNSRRINLKNVKIDGDYPFDGAEDIYAEDCVFLSKDSFWNAKKVTLVRCNIVGEYFSWNSQNINLLDCSISSHQGFCYIEHLTLKNCDLTGTDLSFEYCKDIDADISDAPLSIKNPRSGKINIRGKCELILDPKEVNKKQIEVLFHEN